MDVANAILHVTHVTKHWQSYLSSLLSYARSIHGDKCNIVCNGCSKYNFACDACDNAISHAVSHRVMIERHRTSTGNPTVTQQLLCCWRRQQWWRNGKATGIIALPVPQGWWQSNDDATMLGFIGWRRVETGGEECCCEGGGDQGVKVESLSSSSSLSSTATPKVTAAVSGPGGQRGCSCRGKRVVKMAPWGRVI